MRDVDAPVDSPSAFAMSAADFAQPVIDRRPGGQQMSRLELLYGVLQHDVYHAGQIAILLKG